MVSEGGHDTNLQEAYNCFMLIRNYKCNLNYILVPLKINLWSSIIRKWLRC
jgi:hypothetical protein